MNSRRILPLDDYLPGSVLPPHLSPFVEESSDDYIPPERQAILDQEKMLLKEEENIISIDNGMLFDLLLRTF